MGLLSNIKRNTPVQSGISLPQLTNLNTPMTGSTPAVLPQKASQPFTLQTLKDTITGIPQAFSEVIGQPTMRAYGAIASAITGKPFVPEGQFQKELYGTTKPITPTSVAREFTGREPTKESTGIMKYLDPALGVTFGLLDATPTGKQIKGLLGLSKNARQIIAGSKDVEVIAKLFKQEIPDMTDDIARGFAGIFKDVDDVNKVDAVINRMNYEYGKSVKGTSLATQQTQLAPQQGGLLTKVRGGIEPSLPQGAGQIGTTLGKVESATPKIEGQISLPESIPQGFNPDKYVAEQLASREATRKAGTPTVTEKAWSFLADVKAKLVDFTAPIEDTLNAATKKNKITLLPEEDITNQIDRVLRAPTIAGQFADDNGLVDLIRKVDNIDNLDQYLTAKHSIELDTRGIETGRDLNKDQLLVKSFYDKYEPYAKVVSDYSKRLLDYAENSGLISKKLSTDLRNLYPDYVPFQRVFSEIEKDAAYKPHKGVASLSKQTIIQRIEGSTLPVESPLESLLGMTNDAFRQGEKNLAGKMLASYEKLPNNPFQLKEITGEAIEGRNTVSFLDKGELRTFETTKEIADAAKALNVQQLGLFERMLAAPVRLARLGITGINIPFIAANIAKDQVSAFINSSHGLKTSIANPENFLRSLWSAVGHDEIYKQMVRAGGAGTSYDIARNQAQRTLANIRAGKGVISKIKYTVTHSGELLRAVENVVARGEELTRVQQFRGVKEALLKEGMDEKNASIEAARQAREATVNFSRSGGWGGIIKSVWLYVNAGIQGTRTLLRNLKNKPVQTSMKIALSALFPMAAVTYWNLSDPERKKAYEDIAEYEKENNLIIIPPNPTKDEKTGKWNVIKVPLSQEINSLVGMVRRPIEDSYGLDPVAFVDIANAISGTVSPIKPTKGAVFSTLTPQALKPSLEVLTNKNLFTGLPLVSASQQKLSPENQVKEYTSGTARQIGQKLGVSPIKVEEWIKATFGGIGSQALNVVDRVLAAGGVIPKEQVGGQNVLDAIATRFNTATGGRADDKTITEIQTLLQKQADTSNALKLQAEEIDKELQKLTPEEARAKFTAINKDNPALGDKLRIVVEERKLGLTYEEKLMKQLQVENGERAKYIDQQIMKLKTQEERRAYYEDLVQKKIISPNVARQLKELRDKATTDVQSKAGTAKSTLATIWENTLGAKTASADTSIPTNPNNMSTERIKAEMAFRESGVSETPYTAINENKNGTTDYGKYQVNEKTLASYSKKFIGRVITPQEFLRSPKLQEMFADKAITHLGNLGAKSLDAFLLLWHFGWGDISSARVRRLKNSPAGQQYLNNRRDV